MSIPLNPIITNPGMAAAIAAAGNGLSLAITHLQLGTGTYVPAASGSNVQAALVAPVSGVYGVQPIAGGGVLPSGFGFQVSALFPEPVAAFFVGEIGFWAGAPGAPGSTLFAVYSQTTPFIWRAPMSGDYAATFVVAINALPPGSVTVTVDPMQSLAIAAMNTLILEHSGSLSAHDYAASRTRRMFRGSF